MVVDGQIRYDPCTCGSCVLCCLVMEDKHVYTLLIYYHCVQPFVMLTLKQSYKNLNVPEIN